MNINTISHYIPTVLGRIINHLTSINILQGNYQLTHLQNHMYNNVYDNFNITYLRTFI